MGAGGVEESCAEERVKAESRSLSVKVVYSSAAEVRNSSEVVTVVVLTWLAAVVDVVVDVVDFCGIWAGLLGWYFGVDTPLPGFEPGACWMSFPCSLIKAGASLER